MAKLTEIEIKARLIDRSDWRECGGSISRTFEFTDFPAAMKFVNCVAIEAERSWHHPDIDIRWNKVTLTLSTHSERGLTDKDFQLAAELDRVSSEPAARSN